MSSIDVSDTLAQLTASLVSVSTALTPLLATSLEQLAEDGIDPLEKAKLEVTMAYVVHDLIWIYLKSTGIDPLTHPVMTELDRIKNYFGKIGAAERKDAPPRSTIDKEAAGRFIRAAIGSGKARNAIAGPSKHTRFDSDDVDKILADKEEDTNEDDDESNEDGSEKPTKSVDEDEMVIDESISTKPTPSKRAKMDPFAGYDSPKSQSKPKNKKEKRARVEGVVGAVAVPEEAISETVSAVTTPLSKKQKKLVLKKAKAVDQATL